MVDGVDGWKMKSKPKLPILYVLLIADLIQYFLSNSFHFPYNGRVFHL
jgi:hypothetical protein